jgi:hypothetical protein
MRNPFPHFFLSLIFTMLLVQCTKEVDKTSVHQNSDRTTEKRTWAEVLEIAKERGFPDFGLQYMGKENKRLMCLSDESLAKFFDDNSGGIERSLQLFRFIEAGKNVKCLTDYYHALAPYTSRLDRYYPDRTQLEIEKKEYYSSNYRFFINEQGSDPYPGIPFLVVVKPGDHLPQYKVREIERR